MSHLPSAPRTVPAPELLPAPRAAEVSEVVTFAEALVEDVAVLRRQVEHLQLDIRRRTRIEQACGILMHRYGMDATTASRTLHRWSGVVVLPVGELAEAIVTLTVTDDALPDLPREIAHTVSLLLRRELGATQDRSLRPRTLGRRS